MNLDDRIQALERANRRQRRMVCGLLGACAFAVLAGQQSSPHEPGTSLNRAEAPLPSEAGTDVFGPPEYLPYFGSLPDTGPGVRLAADLNGDGLGDLILRNNAENRFYIMMNTGFDAFQLVQIIEHANNFIDVGDFNGDGQLDIVLGTVGTAGDWSAMILYNQLGGQAYCPGDFDFNSAVDFEDLLTLLGVWGPCAG